MVEFRLPALICDEAAVLSVLTYSSSRILRGLKGCPCMPVALCRPDRRSLGFCVHLYLGSWSMVTGLKNEWFRVMTCCSYIAVII